MTNRKRLNKRIRVDERFDENEPMAKAIRSLAPADSAMDPEARERMMGHLLSVQRSLRREPVAARRPVLRRALVPALAVVLIAAVLAAVLVPMFYNGTPEKPSVAHQPAKFLNLVGSVEVRTPERDWRAAKPSDRIASGWSIRTGAASMASVHFPEGSIARITDGSEARISRITSEEVAIDHISGGTYHRVHKGTKYTVVNSGVASHALGTAFNIENRVPERLEILTVESAVEVVIGAHEPIKVSQGEVMTVSLTDEKSAEKQPVSRERLQDSRLVASVQQDAEAGYPTGVYENIDVPTTPQEEAAQTAPSSEESIQMAGSVADLVATLSWSFTGSPEFGSLVLLRAEGAEPTYPENEIARYTDTSISSATDDTIESGHTYQYRLAGIPAESGEVLYSNTVIADVPVPDQPPGPATVSLVASPTDSAVDLEWSVSGVDRFGGYVLERVVEKAPQGSQTPVGSTSFRRFQSSDVFFSFADTTVSKGHSYSYRVGLVVDGAVMVYSEWRTASVAAP